MSSKIPKKCKICNNNITPKRDRGINCALCGSWYHGQQKCSGLTTAKFDELLKDSAPYWECNSCVQSKKGRRSTLIVPPVADSIPTPTKISPEECQRRIENLEKSLKEEQEKVSNLELQIEELRQKLSEAPVLAQDISPDVENSLEIRNLPQQSLENPLEVAISIGNTIGCELTEEEVDCFAESSVLSLKFSSIATRWNFLKAGKKFNREGKKIEIDSRQVKIFVNEKLTPVQKSLHYKASKISKSHGFKFCWWCNGSLLIKREENHSPILIRDERHLNDMFSIPQPVLSECPRAVHENGPGSSRNCQTRL